MELNNQLKIFKSEQRKMNFLEVVIWFAILFSALFAGSFIIKIFNFNLGPDGPLLNNLLIIQSMSVAAFLAFMKYGLRLSSTAMGFPLKKVFSDYAFGALLGILMICIAVFTSSITGSSSFVKNSASPHIFILFLIGFIIQGMNEEIITRGIIFSKVSVKFGPVAGAIFNSAVFAALHLGNPNVSALAVFNLFLFGIVMSALYYAYESLWIAGAVHSLWNFFIVIVFGVPVSGITTVNSVLAWKIPRANLINGGYFGLEGGLGCTVACLVILAVALLKINKKSRLKD